jgi:hypothetical protein
MTDTRMTKRDLERQLQEAWIVTKTSAAVADALAFLTAELGGANDAVVVAEESDRVLTVSLGELSIGEKTLHLHAFSKSARAQARVARTAAGWVGDAVRECDIGTAGARHVLAQDGRVMCLGERIPNTRAFAEARIKPYEIPAATGGDQIDVTYRNYHEETASGRLACIAHRAVEFVAREVK